MEKEEKMKIRFWKVWFWDFYVKLNKCQIESNMINDVAHRLNLWVRKKYDVDNCLTATINITSVCDVYGIEPKKKATLTANYKAVYVENVLKDLRLTTDNVKIENFTK